MKFVLKQYDTEMISFDLRSEGLDCFVCTSSRFLTDRQRKQLRKLIAASPVTATTTSRQSASKLWKRFCTIEHIAL